MKTKSILAALLIMVAGLQTANAQTVKLYKTNKQVIESEVSELDSIVFVESVPPVLVTKIELNKTSIGIQTGEIEMLTATILPDNAKNKAVTWESSDTSIATVDQTGNVTAIAAGSCTITATAKDGSNVKAECQVVVVQLVTGITLSQTSLSLLIKATEKLSIDIQPANATNKSVTWESSDTDIATVDQSGEITAKAVGSCIVLATATDGSSVKAECQVTVSSPTPAISNPLDGHEWVDLGLPSGTLWATCNIGANSPEEYGKHYAWGETKTKSDFTEENYTYKLPNGQTELEASADAATINWSTNWQTPIAAQFMELIDENNTTAAYTTRRNDEDKDIGGFLITSKTNNNSIFLPLAGVSHIAYGMIGSYMSRTLDMENDTYEKVLVPFYVNGTERIRLENNYHYAGSSVRPVVTGTAGFVKKYVANIELSETSLTLEEDETKKLTATLLPVDAEYKVVTWESSKPSVASVDETGKVTAEGVGSCYIICRATDGSYVTNSCKVTVTGVLPSYLTCPDSKHPHAIDLGLPSGTKWACCNLGASGPKGYGGYYQWSNNFSMDYPWKLPTRTQMEELINHCSYSHGAYGGPMSLTGPNGGQIILPYAGLNVSGSPSDWEYALYKGRGYYWSSTASDNKEAYYLFFDHDGGRPVISEYGRSWYLSVRPVCQ